MGLPRDGPRPLLGFFGVAGIGGAGFVGGVALCGIFLVLGVEPRSRSGGILNKGVGEQFQGEQ